MSVCASLVSVGIMRTIGAIPSTIYTGKSICVYTLHINMSIQSGLLVSLDCVNYIYLLCLFYQVHPKSCSLW